MSGYSPSPSPAPSIPAGSPRGYGPRGPSDDHLFALLSYALTLVAGFIPPLVIYRVKMHESGYVRFHAAQSLNLGITGLAYATGAFMVGLILGVVTHGAGFLVIIPLFIAIGAGELVFLILAATAANRGELYRIPAVACLPIVH